MTDFAIDISSPDGMVRVVLQRSLRAESVQALRAGLTPLRFSRPWLVLADLRELESVDDVSAAALGDLLGGLANVALLLPQPWTQAFFTLSPLLSDLPFVKLPAAHSRTIGPLPSEERRRAPRVAVKILAAIVTNSGETRNGWTLDLSHGGARVASRGEFLLDEQPVALAIAATTISVRAVRLDLVPQPSWGVEFTGPLGALTALVDGLP